MQIDLPYTRLRQVHEVSHFLRIAILARHLPAEIAQKVGNDLAGQFALITLSIKPQRVISYDDAKQR